MTSKRKIVKLFKCSAIVFNFNFFCSYFFMENLRYMLLSYRPEIGIYVGHRFAVEQIPEGYMSGGGYVLSRKALEKFVTQALPNTSICSPKREGNEDWEIGWCLRHVALSVDDRDEFNEKRFFCLNIMEMLQQNRDPNFWYYQRLYYNYTQGNLSCCSQYPVAIHYVEPREMYLLEYLTRKVFPFGFNKKINENLPRKFSFKEIIEKSDMTSRAKLFKNHTKVHYFDFDEKYKRK